MFTKQCFVFGSNRAGRHGKGAALFAKQHFGAETGIGEGPNKEGTCYAIPTKGSRMDNLPFVSIQRSISDFVDYARRNPDTLFLLTPIGTGLAGCKRKDIWGQLKIEGLPGNVVLTASWVDNGLLLGQTGARNNRAFLKPNAAA